MVAVNVVHGMCYAFFFAAVYIFVDEHFPKDSRASAQGLFNLLILGLGPFVGSLLWGDACAIAFAPPRATSTSAGCFMVPAWLGVAALAAAAWWRFILERSADGGVTHGERRTFASSRRSSSFANVRGSAHWSGSMEHAATVDALREAADGRRQIARKRRGAADAEAAADLIEAAAPGALAEHFRGSLRAAINATGVIIHTNLGRAPLAAAAIERLADVARGYSDLDTTSRQAERGSRTVHAEQLLTAFTGAEAAVVVNNNAAATMLILAGLAPAAR